MRVVFAFALLALFGCVPTEASNHPCSQSKGGIVGCLGTKYLCRDGSTSASKRTCQKRADVPLRLEIFTVRNARERK